MLVEYTEHDNYVTNVSFGFRDKPTMNVELDILVAQLRIPYAFVCRQSGAEGQALTRLPLRVPVAPLSTLLSVRPPTHPPTHSPARLNPPLDHLISMLNRLAASVVPMVIAKSLLLPRLKTKWALHGPIQPPYPWQVDFDEARMYIVPKQPERPVPLPTAAATNGAGTPTRSGTPSAGLQRAESTVRARTASTESSGRTSTTTSTEPHAWKVHTYRKSTNCQVCSKVLWGVARQGMRCQGMSRGCVFPRARCSFQPTVGSACVFRQHAAWTSTLAARPLHTAAARRRPATRLRTKAATTWAPTTKGPRPTPTVPRNRPLEKTRPPHIV